MVSRRTIRILAAGGMALALSLTIGGNMGAAGPPASAAFMRAVFVWTDGDAGNHDWNDNCNWGITPCVAPFGPYPDDPGDDATIPTNSGTSLWTVDLVTVSIGDLTVDENVDFGAVSGTVTLEVNQLVIDAGSDALSVTIDGNATIKTP